MAPSSAALTTVGQGIVQSSEYDANLITRDYQQYLGRTPGAAEIAFWVNTLKAGSTEAQVASGFLGSAELFAHARNTPKAWVDSLYQTILGRAPTPAECAARRA